MAHEGERGEGFTHLVEAERRTDDRLSIATDRISHIEGQLLGIVTYKDVLLKFTPLVLLSVVAGAAIVGLAVKFL